VGIQCPWGLDRRGLLCGSRRWLGGSRAAAVSWVSRHWGETDVRQLGYYQRCREEESCRELVFVRNVLEEADAALGGRGFLWEVELEPLLADVLGRV